MLSSGEIVETVTSNLEVQRAKTEQKRGGKKTAFISLSGSFRTASVLGNEKNKEEIFTPLL